MIGCVVEFRGVQKRSMGGKGQINCFVHIYIRGDFILNRIEVSGWSILVVKYIEMVLGNISVGWNFRWNYSKNKMLRTKFVIISFHTEISLPRKEDFSYPSYALLSERQKIYREKEEMAKKPIISLSGWGV